MILHDILLAFFISALLSGGLLLRRLMYPKRYSLLLYQWRSAFLVAAFLFVASFTLLLADRWG